MARGMYAVDPRRTSSAQWADVWLGLDVGTDIALANAMARVIIHAGLANQSFIERATTGSRLPRVCRPATPLEHAERETGVPGRRHPGAALDTRGPTAQ